MMTEIELADDLQLTVGPASDDSIFLLAEPPTDRVAGIEPRALVERPAERLGSLCAETDHAFRISQRDHFDLAAAGR